MSERLVHLVYIHGFRGDETTFQSFPTHLQQYLSDHVPSRLNIRFQSSLYPTYKSVKPISYATRNFLEWLNTQPPGPVILLGHSMGGLLAAEAATDASNNPDTHPGAKPRRIVGMIAFDCPYLGMHPHVVLSGIASLFPKGNDTQNSTKTEKEMNPDSNVKIIDRRVTEDWEAFKDANGHLTSLSLTPTSTARSPSPSFIDRTKNFISDHSDDPLVRWVRKHSDEPFTAGKRWIVEHFQFGSCMFDPSGLKERYTKLVAWNGLWINYWTITIPKAKESNSSSSSLITEKDQNINREDLLADNDAALLESGIADTSDIPDSGAEPDPHPLTSPSDNTLSGAKNKSNVKAAEKAKKAQEKEREKQRKMQKERDAQVKAAAKAEMERNKMKVGRHFIVLPTGLGAILGGGDKWEKVVIGGVEDEVAAHCGLFIPGQNIDYDGLVQRVGTRVVEWCKVY